MATNAIQSTTESRRRAGKGVACHLIELFSLANAAVVTSVHDRHGENRSKVKLGDDILKFFRQYLLVPRNACTGMGSKVINDTHKSSRNPARFCVKTLEKVRALRTKLKSSTDLLNRFY